MPPMLRVAHSPHLPLFAGTADLDHKFYEDGSYALPVFLVLDDVWRLLESVYVSIFDID